MSAIRRLMPAQVYGMVYRMTEMRKITAFVPAKVLQAAQDYTGEGVTETLRQALEKLARQRFYDQLKALRGKVTFDVSLDELREDREFDEHGNVL
jgi:ubiquinone biosynthesis protein UbiJ